MGGECLCAAKGSWIMSKLKTFLVSDSNDTFFVALEVDLDKLTPALASQINHFWGGAEDRLYAEDGDAVRAVIRLLGCKLIGAMLEFGGQSFDERAVTGSGRGFYWMRDLLERKGLLHERDMQLDALGIRLVKADVEIPGFDEMDLDEQAGAL